MYTQTDTNAIITYPVRGALNTKPRQGWCKPTQCSLQQLQKSSCHWQLHHLYVAATAPAATHLCRHSTTPPHPHSKYMHVQKHATQDNKQLRTTACRSLLHMWALRQVMVPQQLLALLLRLPGLEWAPLDSDQTGLRGVRLSRGLGCC